MKIDNEKCEMWPNGIVYYEIDTSSRDPFNSQFYIITINYKTNN